MEWWECLRVKVGVLRSALLREVAEHKQESDVRDLISQMLEFYTSTLPVSGAEDAFASVAGKNNASLEAAFTWFGGWRPTSAIVLVFSTMEIERRPEILNCNVLYPPPRILSERQIYNINTLQAHMRQAECDLSKRLALLQMLVADQDLMTAISTGNLLKAKETVESKISELRDLLVEANSLRLQTLHVLVRVLDPIQAAKCTIAGFELGYSVKTFKECLSKGRISLSRAIEASNATDQNLLGTCKPSTCQGGAQADPSSAHGFRGSSDDDKLFQKSKTIVASSIKPSSHSWTSDDGDDDSANSQIPEALTPFTEKNSQHLALVLDAGERSERVGNDRKGGIT